MLAFYDTRQRRKVQFEPITEDVVKMYTCGPTVYAPAHIGNFRTYIFEDLLRRTLKFSGYRVIQVMNLTDVEDKTIRAANELGISLKEHTAQYIDRFFKDVDALNMERAEYYPAATEHIDLMIDLIQRLLDEGFAYRSENNIYFSIEKYERYGELSGMKLENLSRGVRIDADEYEDKENFRDFALWKGWTEEDGSVWWESPFGKGRPGWHIECSAMSMKYLGEEFDIHTGGVDNIFPHHENEIAQSCAATHKSFAHYWLHSAHLKVEGEKMSKSLGNFYTLQDLFDKGYDARSIRYVLLTTHYRQQLNFTESSVQAAVGALDRLDTLYYLANRAVESGSARPELQQVIDSAFTNFRNSLSDDLGISGAMAALFDLVSSIHRMDRENPINHKEGRALLDMWLELDKVLGVLIPIQSNLPADIEKMVSDRLQYRRLKQFDMADNLRDELTRNGYTLEDNSQGSVIIWAKGRKLIKFIQ